MHCMMVSIGTGIGASMAKKRIETKGKRTDHYWALPHLDLANHVDCANAQHPNSNSDTPVQEESMIGDLDTMLSRHPAKIARVASECQES
jgi:hypothetical protein